MKLRRTFMPQRLEELFCYLLIGFLVPVVFIYDIIIVLPAIHESGSFAYFFTILTGLFLLFNIEGNLLACMLVDTSVDQLVKPPSEECSEHLKWRHCDACDRLAPPRSWHCKACGVCILKRDHHCSFSGCCIGHQNQRYFFCFVLNMAIIAFLATIYSTSYIVINYQDLRNAIKSPILLVNDLWINLQLSVYILHFIAFIFPVMALSYHCPIILRGAVCAEKQNPTFSYDNGVIRNLQTVFGNRMHLVLLSPLVKSELPDNGYSWTSNSPIQRKL